MELTPKAGASLKETTQIYHMRLPIEIKKMVLSNLNTEQLEQELMDAARISDLEKIKFILSLGVDINARSAKSGRTPLGAAMFSDASNRDEVVDYLLDHGTEVNVADNNGRTPLNFAVFVDQENAAKKLIARGASVNSIDKGGVPLLLYLKASVGNAYNNKDLLKLLLDSGANPNAVDKHKESFVHYLINTLEPYGPDNYNTFALNEMIEHGANLNLQNKNGKTPLFTAIVNGNTSMVKFLLDHGAKTDVRDNDEQTPLDLAKERSQSNPTEEMKSIVSLLEKNRKE